MNEPNEKQWTAIAERHEDAQGFYGVVTTGILCVFGCPSRTPLRENARVFDSIAEGLQQGFRLCKRCLSKTENLARVEELCTTMVEKELSVTELAEFAQLSPRHLQRLFKSTLGITPKQFQTQHRLATFQNQVKSGARLIDAVYASGFGSPSRLYDALNAWRPSLASSADSEDVFFAIDSFLDESLIFAQTLHGLCFAGFYQCEETAIQALRDAFPTATHHRVMSAQLEPIQSAFQLAKTVDFSALRSLSLDIRGTAFQARVWASTRNLPVGARVSYQAIADQLDLPFHARAVANALSKNKIALAIPCHRVVPASGGEGGYRWGVSLKSKLLALEEDSSS